MFRRLLTLDETKEIISRHLSTKPMAVEQVTLLKASNRVLANDVSAPMDVPPFDRSTVDGYAINAQDTFEATESKPVTLRICGEANVGKVSRAHVGPGTAVEIVTGAPIPKGANAVVMLEETERKHDELHVYSAVADEENIMKTGSDIRKGETTLGKGTVLHSGGIGILAAAGIARVTVYTVPRVAVLSTGAEVIKPGRRLVPGKIYDTNAYSLGTAVAESGGKSIHLGVFADSMSEIENAVRKGLTCADLVVTSGGVSVGPKDLMPKVLGSLGKPGLLVCGIAIKPGKPATVASIGGKMIFSLPGHPTSALLVFHLLVQPLIETMAGKKPDEPFKVKAFAAERMFSAKGRRTFIMVKLRNDKLMRLVAEPMPTGLSGAITTLAKADGLVEIPQDQQFIDAGDQVEVRLLTAEPLKRILQYASFQGCQKPQV